MRELPLPEELLRPRDHLTVWVRAETWHCPYCPSAGRGASTVDWLGANTIGPNGRCRECGVKLVLARHGEAVPDPEGLSWCVQCHGYVLELHIHPTRREAA
jgi:hypothetical protein